MQPDERIEDESMLRELHRVHNVAQPVLDDRRRHLLSSGKRSGIECRQLAQTAFCEFCATFGFSQAEDGAVHILQRKLAIVLVLFVAGKVLRACRALGLSPHPLGSKFVGPAVEVGGITHARNVRGNCAVPLLRYSQLGQTGARPGECVRVTFMRRSDFLCVAGGALASSALPPLKGRTFLRPFATAPYPYPGKPYRDSTIGLYVPAGYRAGDTIDYVVHFHGFCNDVRHVLNRYRLREQLDLSGRNAILVVPQGPKDARDDDFGKLEHDNGGFARLIDDVAAFLRAQAVTKATRTGKIVLSSHSGGYGGEAGVLARGGLTDAVTDVLMFDTAYAFYDIFASWVKARPDNHLLSLFTEDTENGNVYLMSLVQGTQPNIFVHTAHGMSLAELQTRAPTFILTTVAHDELMQRYNWFSLFLKATALSGV